MTSDLVEKFCTVPFRPITDYDVKAISDAGRFEIPFEEQILNYYSWGNGKIVLLVHGWGSRASHLAPVARILSSSGFKVLAFDAPAHTSVNGRARKEKSNMFEFCRAVSTMVKNVGPVYAIIGHSLGAAASAFTAAGYLRLSDYKINIEKLVLISCPKGIDSMIKGFCKSNNLNPDDELRLTKELEEDFNFSVNDYSLSKAIPNINSDILIVHDTDDEEIPITDAEEISKASSKVQTFYTTGSGHYKILVNRSMLAKVKGFMLGS